MGLSSPVCWQWYTLGWIFKRHLNGLNAMAFLKRHVLFILILGFFCVKLVIDSLSRGFFYVVGNLFRGDKY